MPAQSTQNQGLENQDFVPSQEMFHQPNFPEGQNGFNDAFSRVVNSAHEDLLYIYEPKIRDAMKVFTFDPDNEEIERRRKLDGMMRLLQSSRDVQEIERAIDENKLYAKDWNEVVAKKVALKKQIRDSRDFDLLRRMDEIELNYRNIETYSIKQTAQELERLLENKQVGITFNENRFEETKPQSNVPIT